MAGIVKQIMFSKFCSILFTIFQLKLKSAGRTTTELGIVLASHPLSDQELGIAPPYLITQSAQIVGGYH